MTSSDVRFTSVRFKNYKALKTYSAALTHFNVMVGPNNAGKSTILFSLFQTKLDFSFLGSEARMALMALNVSALRRVGRMRNIRHVLRLPSGGVFELDKFTLPGGELAFEVEIEEEDWERREKMISEVCRLIPAAVPSRASKFQRFREAARRHPSAHAEAF